MIPEIKAEELAGLQKRTALISGTNVNFLRQEKVKKLIEALPNGSSYSIRNSGHLP